MYRATIAYNGRSSTDIFIKDSCAIKSEEQEGEKFFRRELTEKIHAYGEAFDIINRAPFIAELSFTLEKADRNYVYSDYFVGKFYKRDCYIDEESKVIEFEVEPIDKYSPFLEGMTVEFNLLNGETTPIKSPCTFNGVSYIQVAIYDWILNNDSLDNKWKLITNSNVTAGAYRPYARHFSLFPINEQWTKVKGGYVFEINASDPQITNYYDGVEIAIEINSNDKAGYKRIPRTNVFGYSNDVDPAGLYPPIYNWLWIPDTYEPVIYDESINYEDSITFWDALKHFINDFDSSVTFDTTTDYSRFFFDSINPVSGDSQTYDQLRILQKSDATTPYGTPSRAGEMKFQELLEVLKYCFSAYWYIDDQNRFRIEHESYFDNSLTYVNKDNTGVEDVDSELIESEINATALNDFTYAQVTNGREFTLSTDLSKVYPFEDVCQFSYPIGSFIGKNILLSFDYKIENYAPNDLLTEAVALRVVIGGYSFEISIDPTITSTISYSKYIHNASQMPSGYELIKFTLLFKSLYNDPIDTERYRIASGLKITILNTNIKFYDKPEIIGLDLTKYISLKNRQNILEQTNVYEYDYEKTKLRDKYKYMETYNRNVKLSDTRTIRLDDLTVNYKDGSNTEWIENAENEYLISNFVTQINDYLLEPEPNLQGWILLDVDNDIDKTVKYGFAELRQEINAGVYFISLNNRFKRFNGAYATYLINDQLNTNDRRNVSASLEKIRKQIEIKGFVLEEDIDFFALVKTKLGNGQIEEYQVNLNSRENQIKLKYDY